MTHARVNGVFGVLSVVVLAVGCGPGSGDNQAGASVEQSDEAFRLSRPVLASIELSAASVPGGQTLNGIVALISNAPPQGAIISVTSSDDDLALVPDRVLVRAGTSRTSFVITTRPVRHSRIVTITAALGGRSRMAVLQLTALPSCFGVVCAPPGQCQSSVRCNSFTRHCSYTLKPHGTACDDGNPDTVGDSCNNGTCTGVDPCVGVTCPSDQCHTGTCNHLTGTCTSTAVPDGSACDDGNPSTGDDMCSGGTCVGIPLPADDPSTPGDDRAGWLTCLDGSTCQDRCCEVGPGLTWVCATGGVCPPDLWGEIRCDGPEDCPSGQSCCPIPDALWCMAACPVETMCHTDQDCPTGQTCSRRVGPWAECTAQPTPVDDPSTPGDDRAGWLTCLDGSTCQDRCCLVGPSMEWVCATAGVCPSDLWGQSSCDGPEDCPQGQVCCSTPDNLACAPTCRLESICHTERDCPTGQVCEGRVGPWGECTAQPPAAATMAVDTRH